MVVFISPATPKDSSSHFITDALLEAIAIMMSSVRQASVEGAGDLCTAGDSVYALSLGNGTTNATVAVLDISGGKTRVKQAQRFD